MVRNIPLGEGARVVVIGGGPAGAFFSLFAHQQAEKEGRRISIMLFDGKDFAQHGPKGCNLCAGVISETLVVQLADRGIVLPPEKVQRMIEGYHLRSSAGGVLLRHPLHESRITTVFRGNGPRLSLNEENVSFDDFLLDQLRDFDLDIISQPVVDIRFPKNPEEKITVIYGTGLNRSECEADLVVGAFGLNGVLAKKIAESGIGYTPPRTLIARCMEFDADTDSIRKGLGDSILMCNWKSDNGILFGGIIPKKNFVTVNIIGRKNAAKKDFVDFANLPFVRDELSEHLDLTRPSCQCSPRIALNHAHKPFANRFVVVGDASCSRYYKNGIESAMKTAEIAVDVVFAAGVSESALRRGYYRRIRKEIIQDNNFGRILFGFYRLVYAGSFLSAVLLRVLEQEKDRKSPGPMSAVLWNMYTGNAPYKAIFLDLLRPNLQLGLIKSAVRLILERIQSALWAASGKKRARSK